MKKVYLDYKSEKVWCQNICPKGTVNIKNVAFDLREMNLI